ncbi:MAG: CheW protein [Gemmataceae bacterium]|nr:CheW protein [Gemmataceae bacterium]
MAEAKQYCTFTLDGLYFGVEVRHVQEVVRYQEMTRVPLAPAEVRGLINLRGQIVTAVDLRRRVGLPDRPPGRLPMNVVLRRDDGAASLLVDAIGDVIEVEDGVFERPPDTLHGPAREMIRGAFKLDTRLLLVLDAEKVLALTP